MTYIDERGVIEVEGASEKIHWEDKEGKHTSAEIHLWALVLTDSPTHEEPVEIIFRATGAGPIEFQTPPGSYDSTPVPDPGELVEFAEVDEGVEWWDRPGDAVRTVWNLSHPGCWQLRLLRPEAVASIWIGID